MKLKLSVTIKETISTKCACVIFNVDCLTIPRPPCGRVSHDWQLIITLGVLETVKWIIRLNIILQALYTVPLYLIFSLFTLVTIWDCLITCLACRYYLQSLFIYLVKEETKNVFSHMG